MNKLYDRLYLADLEGKTEDDVKAHIALNYSSDSDLEDGEMLLSTLILDYEILIAYESVGDYGCDSASFFLLRHRPTGELRTNYASHCSCSGFEGQWDTEPVTTQFLNSDNFSPCLGGYDDNRDNNKMAIISYIREHFSVGYETEEGARKAMNELDVKQVVKYITGDGLEFDTIEKAHEYVKTAKWIDYISKVKADFYSKYPDSAHACEPWAAATTLLINHLESIIDMTLELGVNQATKIIFGTKIGDINYGSHK